MREADEGVLDVGSLEDYVLAVQHGDGRDKDERHDEHGNGSAELEYLSPGIRHRLPISKIR